MPTRTRQRLLCKKIEAVGKSKYIHIASTKCDEKLRIGYRLLFEAEISDQTIKDCYVHRRCYINVTRNVASITTQQEELEKSLESSTCVAHDDISSEPSCIQTEPDTNMQQIPIINVPSSDPNDFVENIYDYYDDVANTCVSVKTTNGSSITYCRTEMSYDVNLNDGMIMFDQSMNGAEDNLSEITNEQISSSSPAVMNIEEEGSTEILCSSKQLTIEESTSENKTNEYINMTKDTETCVLIDRKNRKSVKSNNTKLKRQRSPSYKILKRISRLSSNAAVDIDHDLNDTVQVNIDNIYTTGFEELCDWLSPVLMKGIIVSMNDIKTKYKQILRMRKERCSSSMLLASAVRARLEQKFGNQIMFYYRRKREGLYVALNDLSVILSKLMHDNKSLSTHHQSVPRVNSNPGTAQRSCENIFETVQLLRQSIENYSHYFSMLKKNRLSLIDLDSNIFWDCIPILLKNFIGLLTASSKEFNEIKKQYDFYSMFTENVLTNHDKKLKIASISYDIINSFNRNFITPKHYLLGNELLRHENSCQLLTITNRLGHTCSYKTMRRLQYEVADKVNTLSDTIQRGQHSNEILNNGFLIKVIDNFDMNKETLHGENSLHMLNQIIVQTIENDESYITANEVINDIIDCISTSTPPSLVVEAIKPPKQLFKYKSCFDLSLKFSLLGYSLVKCFDLFDTNGNIVLSKPIHFPILSGFFATYLNNRIRPIHTGRYCCPIKENPNDVTTIEASLRETKTNILELNRQQTAVVVVDEKLFHICTKVIGNNPNEFDGMFIYPGDFHLIKTTMIVIWQVLDGSGIEDILNFVYKGATLRSILNVYHFNKSFRCCKLLYTALQMLLLESYVKSTITLNKERTSASNISSILDQFRPLFESAPNEYSVDFHKQMGFKNLLLAIKEDDLLSKITIWAKDQSKMSSSFCFWFFLLSNLLEPLMILYSSIRTSDFNARNECVARLGPIFFATNHRNYARLCAEHLFDLSTASSPLIERLAKAFAVVRTRRPFSSKILPKDVVKMISKDVFILGIALDQTIESTINKDGKSHGGISGKFTNESIDVWAKSFSFRAMLSSICHEICKIETNSNSVDSHNECGSSRQVYDNYELQQMLIKLKQEDIFGVHTVQFRKLLSGKIIHHDIIENITTSFIRGEEAMLNYIEDRLVKKNIDISTTLKGMRFLKLSDADTYISGKETNGKKSRLLNIQSKDLSKVLHSVDRLMRDSFIIGEQRDIPLPSIFCHEFTPAPLSLCDINNYHIMNQQKKQIAIDYIRSIFPLSFSSSMPNISGTKALVIDDGAMLQTKPVGRSTTVRPYANQLLKTCDDILDSDYPTLIHNNRAVVASCVRECWSSKITTQQVPYGKVLVVAGPDESSVTLKKFEDPFEDYLLQSNHVEVDTRVFLHAQAISYDNIRSIIIQASDTDVIILGIAHALHLDIDNFYIKSFNTKAKFNTYINVSDIACKLKRKFSMDPMLLLVIHALSGCDTTSFIRNVSKTNIFRTFFSHTHRYSGLNGFFESPLSEESMATAERLLLDCYSTSINSSSLDELRASTAASAFKQNRSRFIAPTLPPTTNGFHHHCQRAAR
ncbi:unnamed protein product [Rotaria magnacalcarata]|uniref:Uncharacterized protein n=1 Tax=Rotaria magnacalcarata TaxID=392030 RepID=A0A816Z5I2_9BILA|nr:unnamed protein product [Rotaria magnacalcarata]